MVQTVIARIGSGVARVPRDANFGEDQSGNKFPHSQKKSLFQGSAIRRGQCNSAGAVRSYFEGEN